MSFSGKSRGRRNTLRSRLAFQAAGAALLVLFAVVFWVVNDRQELNSQYSDVANGEALQLFVIDVGQGDALLLRSGGHDMLVDAGTNRSAAGLVEYLDGLGVSSFDVVVGTHPHEDHIGGLDAVIDRFEIKKLIMPKLAANTATFEDVLDAIDRKGLTVTAPVPGEVYELGSAVITVLGPQKEDYKETNNHSVVLRVDFGKTSFILTGDAERESELDMVEAGVNLKADVLKAGHHGSNSSSSAEFLDAVRPKYVLMSLGEGNSYGHPHKEPLKRFAGLGAEVYRTDLSGTITVVSDGESIKIQTEK